MEKPLTARNWHLLVGLLIGVHVVLGVHFLLHDQSQPYLAALDYMQHVVAIAHRWQHAPSDSSVWGWLGAASVIIEETGFRQPLIILLAFPGIALAGGVITVQAAALQMPIWLALWLWSVYTIGRRLVDAPTGALAAVLTGAAPIVLGHRGMFMPFLPLAAVIAACWAATIAERLRPNWRTRLSLATWLGLGMLIRGEFLIHGAVLLGGDLLLTPAHERLARVRGWLATSWLPLLLAGWWYLGCSQTQIDFYMREGMLWPSHPHEAHIVRWSLGNLCYYPERVATFLLGWPFACLVVPALLAVAWRGGALRCPLLLWWVVTWPFYLLISMKSARYVMPWTTGFALVIAVLPLVLLPRTWARRLQGLFALLALLQAAWLVAGPQDREWVRLWPALADRVVTRGYDFWAWENAQDYGQLRPYRPDAWRGTLNVVKTSVAELALPGQRASVLVCELPINGWLTSINLETTIDVHHVQPFAGMPPEIQRQAFPLFSAVLVSGPGEESLTGLGPSQRGDAADPKRQARFASMLALLAEELSHRRVLRQLNLPDGSTARLYGPRGQ
jgi:hypothetical protein